MFARKGCVGLYSSGPGVSGALLILSSRSDGTSASENLIVGELALMKTSL